MEERRLMVLIGPHEYDVTLELCTETPKLYKWSTHYGTYHQLRKSKYIGLPVKDKAEGNALMERIKAERKKDGVVMTAYWDKLRRWNTDNPKPKPRPPQEVLAALGITHETESSPGREVKA